MNIAVIFAGGVGNRMRTRDIPKQFLEVHGKAIIVRTVEVFEKHNLIDAIVVVCVDGWLEYCREVLNRAGVHKVVDIVPGGKTGQLSIYNGLIRAKDYAAAHRATVLVHDGVRPLVDEQTITKCIEAVEKYGTAITCVRAKETILTMMDDGSDNVREVVDRSACVLARAPQCFDLDTLVEAHEWAMSTGRDDFIDSATLMMERGYALHAVEGKTENIKVTTHDDYYALQAALNARENMQLAEV